MKAKSLLFSILAAAALLVSCNYEPSEVVAVSAENPNINGTWIYSDNTDTKIYKLIIEGNTITANYAGSTGGYSNSVLTYVDASMSQVFENCVTKTNESTGVSSVSFIYDYSITIYPETTTGSNKTAKATYNYDSFEYEVINGCLYIKNSITVPTIYTSDYDEPSNSTYYEHVNASSTMIPAGVYYYEN